eukprot:GHVL01035430.1.p1 GENE.GHVL01035430.1~~GHVL01035430.1.p1  ORF type:complete len:334 (+),score=47.52 GHVL01035430.1:419-1420(+)
MGVEDSSAFISAAIASSFGRLLKAADSGAVAMIPVGFSAGIAASLNCPISGVTFTFEELLHFFSRRALGGLCVATAFSTLAARYIMSKIFHTSYYFPTSRAFSFVSYWWIIWGVVMGILGGVMGRLFIFFLTFFRKKVEKLPKIWTWPLIGLFSGSLGYIAWTLTSKRALFGEGTFLLELLIHHKKHSISWWGGALLFIFKMSCLCLGNSAHAPGGLIGPIIHSGALLGYVSSFVFRPLVTSLGSYIDDGAEMGCICLGMGALFASVFRAPVTSILIVYEMTRADTLILPLMVANILSILLSGALSTEMSFFDKFNVRISVNRIIKFINRLTG